MFTIIHHLDVTYLFKPDEAHIKEEENSTVHWLILEEAITMPKEGEMISIYQKLNEKL